MDWLMLGIANFKFVSHYPVVPECRNKQEPFFGNKLKSAALIPAGEVSRIFSIFLSFPTWYTFPDQSENRYFHHQHSPVRQYFLFLPAISSFSCLQICQDDFITTDHQFIILNIQTIRARNQLIIQPDFSSVFENPVNPF